MKTGFYNIRNLSKDELKAFFTEAVMLSYDAHVEIIDCSKSWSRELCTEKTVEEMIDHCHPNYHNICIDRSIQYDKTLYGEIGYCTLRSPDYFLYIFVTLDNLKILVDKFKLEMK
jgi:hypothetical protein